MRISTVDLVQTVRGTRAAAEVTLDDGTRWRLWFEVPSAVAPEQAHDAMFAVGLACAYRLQQPLVMVDRVSPRLVHQAKTWQNLFELWHPALHPVPIQVTPRPAAAAPALPAARGVATCFTGGVDSLYSALTAPGEVQYALFVQGFDVPLHRTARLAAVTSRLRRTSRHLGLHLLVARSNLVEQTRGTVEWGPFLHGAALAAVGMLTAAKAPTLVVPSSGSSAHIAAPNGSHHALDGLHDTEYSATSHHGTFVERGDKTAAVAASPVALAGLRVCYRQGGLNCGVCHKCVRTQLELEAIGAGIRQGARFDVSPTREQLLAMVVVNSPKSHRILSSTRDFAARQGADDIVAGLTRHLRRYEFQQARAQLVASVAGARPAELRRLSRRLRRSAATAADGPGVEAAPLPPDLRRERRRLRLARSATTPAA